MANRLHDRFEPLGWRIASIRREEMEDMYTYPLEQSTQRMANRPCCGTSMRATHWTANRHRGEPMMNGAKRPGPKGPKEELSYRAAKALSTNSMTTTTSSLSCRTAEVIDRRRQSARVLRRHAGRSLSGFGMGRP